MQTDRSLLVIGESPELGWLAPMMERDPETRKKTQDKHNKTDEVLVTIGICVKDGERTIARALKSILAQDFSHELMELIVADDGSEDRTIKVVSDITSVANLPVRVFHHQWKGLGATRNVALDNAKGKYIIWVDADMMLPHDFVRKQVSFMEDNRKVAIARGKYLCRPENVLTTLRRLEYVVAYERYGGKATKKLPGMGGTVCRTEALREAGSFDSNLIGAGEDQDIAYRVKESGWSIYFATDAVFFAEQERTLRRLWRKYYWHGIGNFALYKKNRELVTPHRMTPLASLYLGILFSSTAYRLTGNPLSFLLPFFLAFEATAWSVGFMKGQMSSFG